MLTRKRKLLLWMVTFGLVMACVPSFTATVPTPNPVAVNTFIAQTVVAASTQTAASLPSATPTNTVTPTPRNTETASPTATSTFIFILSSPTPIFVPTFTPVGGGTSSDKLACEILSLSPANGTSYNSRADFDATWTVKNIGKNAWDRNSIDFVYLSGDKFHKVSGYDLSKDVKVGGSIILTVDMKAPKNSGNYTTRWTLRSGDTNFCTMSLTINVR